MGWLLGSKELTGKKTQFCTNDNVKMDRHSLKTPRVMNELLKRKLAEFLLYYLRPYICKRPFWHWGRWKLSKFCDIILKSKGFSQFPSSISVGFYHKDDRISSKVARIYGEDSLNHYHGSWLDGVYVNSERFVQKIVCVFHSDLWYK